MPATPKNSIEIAMEEWKLLDGIIARLEDVEYKIRSWLFPLLTALAIAPAYLKDPKYQYLSVPPWLFLPISILLIFTFMAIEWIHRLPKRQAINRAKEVEEFLRCKKTSYDGPRITTSLTLNRRTVLWSEGWRMIKHGPYIPLILLVLLVQAVYLLPFH